MVFRNIRLPSKDVKGPKDGEVGVGHCIVFIRNFTDHQENGFLTFIKRWTTQACIEQVLNKTDVKSKSSTIFGIVNQCL